MSIYKVIVYNDMGNLTVVNADDSELPNNITSHVYTKTKSYINHATDNTKMGARFYILKPNLSKYWTFFISENNAMNIINIINVKFELNTFDPKKMTMLR